MEPLRVPAGQVVSRRVQAVAVEPPPRLVTHRGGEWLPLVNPARCDPEMRRNRVPGPSQPVRASLQGWRRQDGWLAGKGSSHTLKGKPLPSGPRGRGAGAEVGRRDRARRGRRCRGLGDFATERCQVSVRPTVTWAPWTPSSWSTNRWFRPKSWTRA